MRLSLATLERWYASQCDGEWEHRYGITIESLDNPGWRIRVSLQDTQKQYSSLERVVIERTETDWIQYWVENQEFQVACGPLNLGEAIKVFVGWFESG